MVITSKFPPEYSGSGHRCHNTYVRLKSKYKIQYKILCSSITYNDCKNYTYDGINVTRISKKNTLIRKFKIKYADKLLNKIATLIDILNESLRTWFYLIKHYSWFDVIHVFGNVNVTSAAITFAKVTKKPIIIEIVNLVERVRYYEPRLISYFLGAGYPKHAKIVAISQALKDVCIKSGIKEDNIWCRPNPIDETKFFFRKELEKKVMLRKFTRTKDEKIILHLAKFMPRKKQDFMIEVLRILPEKFSLILAGPLVTKGPLADRDEKYLASIKKLIKQYDLTKRVTIISEFINNPQELITISDIFVLPSVWEGLGTPVLESLACGTPVITNDIPGVFDQWVKNGQNGYICKLDPKIWRRKIEKAVLINQQNMYLSSENILENASTKVIDKQYHNLFKELSN